MAYTIQEKLLTKNVYTRTGTKLKSVKGIVIHWTANEKKGAHNEAHYKYFETQRSTYASAHYFVDKDGILRIVPDNEMCYHVGAKKYTTTQFGTYPNNCTIGVEMCVNSDGNFAETYKKSVWLCAHLLVKHNLNPDKDLVRHYDITGKDCPKMFVHDSHAKSYLNTTAAKAWAQFKADVKAAYNEMKNPAPKKEAVSIEEVVKEMSKYFKDVDKSAWYADSVDKAKELDLMNGKTADTFDPKGNVSRAELAATIVRVYDKLNKTK